MTPGQFRHLASLLALSPLLAAGDASAGPPPRTPDTVPVCTIFRDQKIAAGTSDGNGGAILAWLDGRNGFTWAVFAQHVRSDLTIDPAWPVNGAAPNPSTAGEGDVAIVPDGTGGAFLAWQEAGSVESATSTIKAQHILANGVFDPHWPTRGKALAPSTGDQIQTVMVSDGAGGAIAAWLDRRNQLAVQAFAQHVRADGTVDPAWPAEGRQVSNVVGQSDLRMVTDGAGGAILVWGDFRAHRQEQFAAQRLRANGSIDARWPADGRVLSSDPSVLQQYALDVIADGEHGAILAWNSYNGVRQHVVAQRLREDGSVNPSWSDTGRVVSHGLANQFDPILASDEQGGAYVAWEEIPDTLVSIHLQHLSAEGSVDAAWPSTGLALGSPQPGQGVTDFIPDGRGGATVTWAVTSPGAISTYSAQRLDPSGRFDPSWPAGGQPLIQSTQLGSFPVVIVPSGDGGELAAWSVRGVPSQGVDAFAGAVRANGRLVRARRAPGETPGDQDISDGHIGASRDGTIAELNSRLTFAGGSPNPSSHEGSTLLRFTLPRDEHVRLEVFNATGRRVAVVVDRALSAGPNVVVWDGRDQGGRIAVPGVYFYRLSAGGENLVSKEIRL